MEAAQSFDAHLEVDPTTIRYVVNARFDQAVLFFADRSTLQVEHTSRDNRWVKPSRAGSMADGVCQAMTGFRLNAKHLQLYFADGSNVEFGAQRE